MSSDKNFVMVLLIVGALVLFLFIGPIGCSLGTPKVTPVETYDQKGSDTFDHALLGEVLTQVVNGKGLVNYRTLQKDHARLDLYLESLAAAPFDDLDRNDKLAFLINAYNACTLKLILDHYPLTSVKDIPASERWQGRKWLIAGRKWTLHEIEHDECRAKFKEPRVHFALNCASISCPPLRGEPFVGSRIEEQLEDQARIFVNGVRWCQINIKDQEMQLSKIFDWYEADFLAVESSLASYVAKTRQYQGDFSQYSVGFLSYDWNLNDSQ